MRESPFLRPQASWRRLNVTFGAGLAIQKLDVLEIPPLSTAEDSENRDGVLTMGLFYDFMVSGEGAMTTETMDWRLLPGYRLGSFDEWLRVRSRSSESRGIIKMFELFIADDESRHSAVLFITAQEWHQAESSVPSIDDEGLSTWEPRAIGGIPVVLHQ
ncbi:hypothetical protein GGS26DRAFT_456443 [Hypomontagnella submonticulosa]|nr:hypothetical protein GGS26DRAFT_456443 [Hypomontagnella submonticulosa]